MKLWLRLSMRNVMRNGRRTALTAGTVLLATALLTVAISWIHGMFGGITRGYTAISGHIRVLDADYAAREELMPLHEAIMGADAMAKAIRGVKGVVDAQPRITTGVAITANDEIGEEFTMVVGATAQYYADHLQGPEHLVAGEWLSGATKEVVLGRKLAQRVEAAVGDEVLMLGQTQYGSMSPIAARVVGIVSSNAMVDRQAFLPLEEVRYLTDMPDGAVEILVYGASMDADDLNPLISTLAAHPALKGMQVRGWHQREPWASMSGVLTGVQIFIQGLIVFVAALAIFNTMTMSVMERSNEIGVMRAMGLTRLGALGLFVFEAMVIGLLGGIAGAGLGGLGGLYLELNGITLAEDVVDKIGTATPMESTIYGDVTTGIVLTGVMLGLVIAVVGAILPALRAASIQPVTAMRARR